jgi:exportin-2 (importin alpha re-exporter)
VISLCSQEELPDFFVENMSFLMGICSYLLDDISKPLTLKKTVVRLINLYSKNFQEDFEAHSNGFFEKIWNLIEKAALNPKENSKLTASIIKYLHTMVNVPDLAHVFKTHMEYLFKNLLIPNIMVEEEDIEEFEDEPENYIKQDLEESDIETSMKFELNFREKKLSELPS